MPRVCTGDSGSEKNRTELESLETDLEEWIIVGNSKLTSSLDVLAEEISELNKMVKVDDEGSVG